MAYFTYTAPCEITGTRSAYAVHVTSGDLIGLEVTEDLRTGQDLSWDEEFFPSRWTGSLTMSIRADTPEGLALATEALPEEARAIRSSHLWSSLPANAQAALQAVIDLDDAEAMEQEATEQQHANEFRAWQIQQYGEGI